MSKTWQRALVVGASSGLGEALAHDLAASGAQVVLIARRAERLESICNDINARVGSTAARAVAADVRETGTASQLFVEIDRDIGGLDLVVYAAGVLPPTTPNQYNTAADVDAINTNLSGAVAWLNAAAKHFSERGSGTIVGISSVAGDRGRRANPAYNASKAALSSYLESLRNRLASRGVTVVTVKPGLMQTAMIEGRQVFPPPATAASASRRILSAAASGRRVIYVPWWWWPIMVVVRVLPAPVMERLPI